MATTDMQKNPEKGFCTAVVQSKVGHGILRPRGGKQGGDQPDCDVKVHIRLQARKLPERN